MLDLRNRIGRRNREVEELEKRVLDARLHMLFDDHAPTEYLPSVASTVAPPTATDVQPQAALAQVEEHVVRDGRGRITKIRVPVEGSSDSVDERDRLKTELIGLASHQLRTPLTSIKGYAALLMDGEAGELSDDQREWIQIIKNNSDRLVALLEDVVDLARIPSAAA